MASSEEDTRSMKSDAKTMAAAAEDDRRILKMDSAEDRKILMKVKAEEGRILKLKKQYVAASMDRLYPLDGPPFVLKEGAQDKPVSPTGNKTKKVIVKKLTTMTKAQMGFIRTMATHPCPTRNLPEDELAKCSRGFQHSYRQSMLVNETRLAYLEALIDQQERFGYAVDESEDEVTDDEGDDLVEGIKLLGSRI